MQPVDARALQAAFDLIGEVIEHVPGTERQREQAKAAIRWCIKAVNEKGLARNATTPAQPEGRAWVVMGNDFPAAVHLSKTAAVADVAERTANAQELDSSEPERHIYWHLHDFPLARTVPAAWQRLGANGWVSVDPEDIAHYAGKGQEVRALYAGPVAIAGYRWRVTQEANRSDGPGFWSYSDEPIRGGTPGFYEIETLGVLGRYEPAPEEQA